MNQRPPVRGSVENWSSYERRMLAWASEAPTTMQMIVRLVEAGLAQMEAEAVRRDALQVAEICLGTIGGLAREDARSHLLGAIAGSMRPLALMPVPKCGYTEHEWHSVVATADDLTSGPVYGAVKCRWCGISMADDIRAREQSDH